MIIDTQNTKGTLCHTRIGKDLDYWCATMNCMSWQPIYAQKLSDGNKVLYNTNFGYCGLSGKPSENSLTVFLKGLNVNE